MSVIVTLHVFSGVPDPSWELSEAQAEELAVRLAALNTTTLSKPPGVFGGLGYRGFSIASVREPRFERHTYVHAGIVEFSRFDLNRLTPDSDLETWLLDSGGSVVPADVAGYVRTALGGPGSAPAAHPAFVPTAVPPFDPGKWNNDPMIRSRNNCYNYANDKITNTFAQPGRGSGLMWTALDCGNVGAAAGRDGQVPVSSASSTPAQGHFVALVMWPGNDYHWYRLDANAMWSHKPGQTPARNTDNSGLPITDPRTCNRGPYVGWCGFYHSVPMNTRIA